MKKAIFVSFALVLVLTTTYLLAQKSTLSIADRWKKVEAYAQKELPESALKEIDIILKQAQKEHRQDEVIKAMVCKMRFTLDKDPDKASELIREFEAFTLQTTDPATRALLHSMTGELYANYYNRDSWTINQRTEIKGAAPEDMKEWTRNMYYDRVVNELQLSLQQSDILKKASLSAYSILLIKGNDSPTLRPTLFDFLANRAIEVLRNMDGATAIKNPLKSPDFFAPNDKFVETHTDSTYARSIENPIVEIYQQLLKFRLTDHNIPALLNIDLDRLGYMRNTSDVANKDSLYLEALKSLKTRYANSEYLVEVIAEEAGYYMEDNNDELDWENVRAVSQTSSSEKSKRIAYDLCAEGIKRFPKYKRIGLLRNIQKEIETKSIKINYNETVKPAADLKVELTIANVTALELQVYRLNATAQQYLDFHDNRNSGSKLYPNRTLVESRKIKVKPDADFGDVKDEFTIKAREYGIYEFTLTVAGDKKKADLAKGTFTVTDFAFIHRTDEARKQSLFVVDRVTGHPVSDVKVSVKSRRWNRREYVSDSISNFVTNTNGYGQFWYNNEYSRNILFFSKAADKYYSAYVSSGYYYSPNSVEQDEKESVALMTDRAIYRPGQTMYFKGIAYKSNKHTQKVEANKEYTVTLVDANYKLLETKTLRSNAFGSFAGEFILPSGGLNGQYHLQCNETSNYFSVEEYKRPTFEVSIPKVSKELRFGEKVQIAGQVKAFAGYSISDATIKYRIMRRAHYYCWWMHEPDKQVAAGTLKSDAGGKFELSFVPEKNNQPAGKNSNQVYTYTVYADVTDPKGETQKGEQTVSVGDISLIINAGVPDEFDKAAGQLKIPVSTTTINDELVNSTVHYELFSVKEPSGYYEKDKEGQIFKHQSKVLVGDFNTQDKSFGLNVGGLKSGLYSLVLTTKDAHGAEVKIEKNMVLYSLDDQRPPVKTYVWLQSENLQCKAGEKATIHFGTSTRDSRVLYELMQGNSIIESRWITISDEIMTFEIPYIEKYGAGVTAQFSFVKDEQFFTRSVQIQRQTEAKAIKPKLSVFRDKLQPGEKAQWTVIIPECKNKNNPAELLVDMYDASLDKIRDFSWNFNPAYHEWMMVAPSWYGSIVDKGNDDISVEALHEEVYQYDFDQLNWFQSGIFRHRRGRPMLRTTVRFTAPVIKKDEEMMDEMKSQEEVSMAKGIISIADVKGNDDVNGEDIAGAKRNVNQTLSEVVTVGYGMQKKKIQTITPRTNFNETAFFYPQLQTDSAGNVQFSFTAPESLTRWNVKMLAHTRDLYFGQAEAQVVTQKELMVQMNLPRFVRRSDKLTLSANVVNLSDKAQTADVAFQLIDPATNQPIVLKNAPAQQVALAANETKVVSWEVSEFSPYELVVCKVVASSEQFSDGEQKYLPVLPDKVLLTESMPLIIRGGQSRDFRFESLMKNAAKVETKNLAVEFSANPAWYAVQALPTISEPNDDNAISLFTAYYANTLAGWMANSSPKISAMFDRWKNEGGSREALLSNLQKNAELKNMLLEETPWVMAAQNETEQKRQIALLFDLNNQKNKSDQYWDKLQKLQLPSGGFAWFAGMPESRYTTLEILLNWARLQRMTKSALPGDDARLSSITHALEYLDLEIAHDFSDLKKYNKNYEKENCLSDVELFYLHTRSEYPQIPLHESAKEAVKFYTAQAEKYWHDCTLYGKAMMAVTFNRNGNKKLAVEILNSLKENALKTDEMGMYWARNASGYFWNERPIAVQAAIINAFTELEPGSAAIDELKIWLLKQKQTQSWDNPLASVNAIYALLNNGSNWLNNESTTVVKVDGKELKPATKEAGTGYFKQTIPTANLTSAQLADLSKVKVISTAGKNSSVGWGAMYWQFYQNQEEVEAQGGALKVSKNLYVMTSASEGVTPSHTLTNQMTPVSATTLHKGDKVITRLVVTTDRNLEYVALKDLRAACFEPVNQLSGYQWKEGVGYYQTSKDASTQFFFSYLPKGTYVFEYELWVNNSGTFTSGITSLQCQYAPEFVSHSGGQRIVVK